MCPKLSETNTCDKFAGLEMKPSTVNTITECGTIEKHMFHLKDTLDFIRKQLILAKRHNITFKPCSTNMESDEMTFAALFCTPYKPSIH